MAVPGTFYVYAAIQRSIFGFSFGSRQAEKGLSQKLLQLQAKNASCSLPLSPGSAELPSRPPGSLTISVGADDTAEDLEPDLGGYFPHETPAGSAPPSSRPLKGARASDDGPRAPGLASALKGRSARASEGPSPPRPPLLYHSPAELLPGCAETKTFQFRGAVIEVCPGLVEYGGGHMYRIQPVVRTGGQGATIVFYGALANTAELLSSSLMRTAPSSPPGLRSPKLAPTNPSSLSSSLSTLEEMFEMNGSDSGVQSAELVLSMYHRCRDDPVLLLNELQGHYAFAIYDSERRQVFAARDSSGRHPLFYHVSEGEHVALASCPMEIPGGESESDWIPMPAGHFLLGAKLRQFALTRDQLRDREHAALYGRDSDGEDAPSGRSPPLGASPTGRGVVSPSRAALPWAHTPSLRAQCRDDDEDLLGLSL